MAAVFCELYSVCILPKDADTTWFNVPCGSETALTIQMHTDNALPKVVLKMGSVKLKIMSILS